MTESPLITPWSRPPNEDEVWYTNLMISRVESAPCGACSHDSFELRPFWFWARSPRSRGVTFWEEPVCPHCAMALVMPGVSRLWFGRYAIEYLGPDERSWAPTWVDVFRGFEP